MIFSVLGLRSPLTTWCQKVVSALVARSGQAAREIYAESASDLLREIMAGDGPVVLLSHRPDASLRDALARSGKAFLVTAVSPRTSVEYLRRGGEPDVLDVIRCVMADVAALVPLIGAESRKVIEPRHAAADGPAAVMAIAAHLGLGCSEAEAAAIHADSRKAARVSDDVVVQDLARDEQVALSGAVDGCERILLDGTCERIAVTRHFFRIPATGRAPLEPIDATGRSQILLIGPFLALPPGDWTARCVYGFSQELVGIPMSIDVVHFVGGFHEVARTSFTVTSAGRLDVNVRFLHTDPAAILEVRLFSDRSVFDGRISVGLVEFRRNAPETMPLEEALAVGDELHRASRPAIA